MQASMSCQTLLLNFVKLLTPPVLLTEALKSSGRPAHMSWFARGNPQYHMFTSIADPNESLNSVLSDPETGASRGVKAQGGAQGQGRQGGGRPAGPEGCCAEGGQAAAVEEAGGRCRGQGDDCGRAQGP